MSAKVAVNLRVRMRVRVRMGMHARAPTGGRIWLRACAAPPLEVYAPGGAFATPPLVSARQAPSAREESEESASEAENGGDWMQARGRRSPSIGLPRCRPVLEVIPESDHYPPPIHIILFIPSVLMPT